MYQSIIMLDTFAIPSDWVYLKILPTEELNLSAQFTSFTMYLSQLGFSLL